MTITTNDLRQWQHDKRVQIEVRRLAGDAADKFEQMGARIEALEAALKPFADRVDYVLQDMEPYRQAYRVLYGHQQYACTTCKDTGEIDERAGGPATAGIVPCPDCRR